MQPISKTRIFVVTFVAILTLILTYPTARYYMFLRQPEQAMKGTKPDFKTPPPPESDKVAYENWKKDNPEYAKWLADNQAYLAWEKKSEDLRASAIPLGLDLIGGVDVTLVIDKEKAIANELNNMVDTLNKQFDVENLGAKAEVQGEGINVRLNKLNAADAQKVVNIIKNWAGYRLLSVPTADELAKGQLVTLNLNQIELNKAIKGDLEGAKKGITDRVDALGVTQPRVNLQGEDRIRVQVPGEKDPDRVLRTVIQPAVLEFHLVDPRNSEVIGSDGKIKPGVVIPPGTEVLPMKEGKLNRSTNQMQYTESSILVNKKAELTGKDLRRASVDFATDDIENPIHVGLEFNEEGARKFAKVTGDNVGHRLAIVLDGVVRQAPNLKERIGEGRATITGGFTQEEASDLVQILKAGALKAPLKIESKRTVGATLGRDSILSGVEALAAGSVIITVLMVGYYGTAGMIAVFALFLHILIILALMALSKATMTLSGIGGVLLTVGMAVDANILIYERMREEVRAGKPMKQAISLGFHRAFAVILDSNVTTLLSALVLLQFTEGSVLGFALTMAFGIVANLFTGLTVTYTLCGLWFEKFGHLSLGKIAIFRDTKIKFVEMRYLSWGGSSMLGLLALIILLWQGGLTFGVDFAGGYRAEVQFTQPQKEALLRKSLENAGLKDINIQNVTDPGQPNYYIIDMKMAVAADTKTSGTAANKNVAAGSETKADLQATQDRFDGAMKKAFPAPGSFLVKASSGFGPQTSQEFKWLAVWVTFLSSISILIYLWFRFELVFGVAAVVALLHDMFIVFMLACVWGVQVNLEVVAAMMVLMGFSVNDTIVIFDRIRENTRIMPSKSFGEICDLAMNQCLSRTILTSGTVFLAALCLFMIGGEGLSAFAKIYVIGTIVGTYSSDFIAAPIVYAWNKYKGDRVRQMLAQVKKKKEAAKPIRENVRK